MAEEITDGSYETRIAVKSQDEVGLLAETLIGWQKQYQKDRRASGNGTEKGSVSYIFPKADGWSGCRESSLI